MSDNDKKFCNACKYSDGYRCKHERIAEYVELVIGMEATGADADTFTMRLSESACGFAGNWWKPR